MPGIAFLLHEFGLLVKFTRDSAASRRMIRPNTEYFTANRCTEFVPVPLYNFQVSPQKSQKIRVWEPNMYLVQNDFSFEMMKLILI